jgi:peptide/nickel transport system ATP-binding protein
VFRGLPYGGQVERGKNEMTVNKMNNQDSDQKNLLELDNVVKHFDISGGLLDQLTLEKGKLTRKRTTVKAVNNVSFSIAPGETFSVVGESGCGKSTLARATIGIYPPNSGRILYRGERIDDKDARQMLPYRRKMQMIFQDPYASLNPRKTAPSLHKNMRKLLLLSVSI